MTIRRAQKTANVLLLASVGARMAWPSRAMLLGCAFLAIASIRLALMIPDIRRGNEPWQRLLVPGIVLLQVATVLSGHASRALVGGVTAALEIALLGAAAWFTIRRYRGFQDHRYPEEALSQSLTFFVPPAVADAIAGEMVNLGYAIYGIARGFRLKAPAGFTYLDNSIVPFVALAVLFESPPEILLLHKLIRIHGALLLAGLIGLHVWAVLWICGIYVSMRMRPHRVAGDKVEINRGALGTLRIELSTIAAVHWVKEGEEPAADLKFTVKGPPRLLIELREPIRARRFMRGLSAPASTLLISVDHPSEFREALMISSRFPA